MHFLSIIWNPNETLLSLGPIQIKYYNLLWITAFILGWYIVKKIFQNEKKPLEQLDSLFLYMVLSTMIGARLGHCFFYDWPYYQDHLLEILLPIRETASGYEFSGFAGLASHGAAIGVIIGMLLYQRKYKDYKVLWLLDRMVIPTAIGAFLVRLGNFFNSEIHGKIVDKSFAFATKFVRDSATMSASRAMAITKRKTANAAYKALEHNSQFADALEAIPYRHPAQLYEGICYIFVFIILSYFYWKTDKKDKAGFLFGLFLILLMTIRFFVEFVKKSQGGFESSAEGALSTGQWLSIPFILIGAYFVFRPKRSNS